MHGALPDGSVGSMDKSVTTSITSFYDQVAHWVTKGSCLSPRYCRLHEYGRRDEGQIFRLIHLIIDGKSSRSL